MVCPELRNQPLIYRERRSPWGESILPWALLQLKDIPQMVSGCYGPAVCWLMLLHQLVCFARWKRWRDKSSFWLRMLLVVRSLVGFNPLSICLVMLYIYVCFRLPTSSAPQVRRFDEVAWKLLTVFLVYPLLERFEGSLWFRRLLLSSFNVDWTVDVTSGSLLRLITACHYYHGFLN